MELKNSVWNELCTTVGRTVGPYYNQDECAFCPSIFHLFAGSEHSQGPLTGPRACSTSRFSFSGFLSVVIKNIWRSKRCKIEHNTQFCRQNLPRKRNHSSLHTNRFKGLDILLILSFER